MYRRILVPTDGSENTQPAIEQAIELASTYDASVHALYVVNTGAMPSPEPDFRERYIDEGERIGRQAVDAIADAGEAAGVDVTASVTRGTPSEEILEYAADNDIDLIVMGTHGRTGMGHFLLGSVAERVIRQSEDPVLVVRTASD